jgi:hypothetical protein
MPEQPAEVVVGAAFNLYCPWQVGEQVMVRDSGIKRVITARVLTETAAGVMGGYMVRDDHGGLRELAIVEVCAVPAPEE